MRDEARRTHLGFWVGLEEDGFDALHGGECQVVELAGFRVYGQLMY